MGDWGDITITNFLGSYPEIHNSIFWCDDCHYSGYPINDEGVSFSTVTYSNVQGGWPGEGNINEYPLFKDAAADDLRLDAGSPCIDAGDNTAVYLPAFDYGGFPRKVDDPLTPDTGNGTPPIVDMGAYEYGTCIADLDLDGDSDGKDLATFAEGNTGISLEDFAIYFGKVDCR